MPQSSESTLEEYRCLRQEILERQKARTFMLAFTFAAVGTIVGVSSPDAPIGKALLAQVALVHLALVLVIAALISAIDHTQQIDRIGAYIERFIEDKDQGLNWHTRWALYRGGVESRDASLRRRIATRPPRGASKPIALYYAILDVALLGYAIALQLHETIWFYSLTALSFIGFLAAIDLYRRLSRGWHVYWAAVDSKETQQAVPQNTTGSSR